MKPRRGGGLMLLAAAMVTALAVYLWGEGVFVPGSSAMGGKKMQVKWNGKPAPENKLDKAAPKGFKTATFALG